MTSAKGAFRRFALASALVLALGLCQCAAAQAAWAEVREYRLDIARQEVNLSGRPRPAMTINKSIPGPVLRFREGDTALIHVRNLMDVPTSVHWHGILLPPGMDGVPDISFPPIAPGRTFTYRFPLRQSGTYWYHSHSGLQEQRGVYGAMVIQPRRAKTPTRTEHVVMLSDWTDEDPRQVLRNLKRGSDWYSLAKGSSQSLLGAARAGKLGAYLGRELGRMPAMDISDVAYDRFLINGKPQSSLAAKPGETLLLRVINGSASTFFHVEFAGGPITIVAADGQEVEPVKVKRLLLGVAETYDVLVKMPTAGRPEFRATAHDASSWASLWLGRGKKIPAPRVPAPELYQGMGGPGLKQILALDPASAMGMPDSAVHAGKFDRPGMAGMDHGAMGHMGHDMGGQAPQAKPAKAHGGHGIAEAPVDKKNNLGLHGERRADRDATPPDGKRFAYDFRPLAADNSSRPRRAGEGSAARPNPPYAKLRAPQSTAFDPKKPVRNIRLTLDGDMERYVWSLNGQTLSEADDILIKEGQVVRFIMINRTMMNHPMHLHGHFFRVLNGQGDHAPLKHTVVVAPMSTTVIEFDANEKGDWFFHCHLLYHMMAGMARLVHYQGFEPPPAVRAIRPNLYKESWYAWLDAELLSNMTEGKLHLDATRHAFTAKWKAGWQRVEQTEWEITPTYDYVLDRFKSLFLGADASGGGGEENKVRGVAGVRYLLPLNLASSTWLDTDLGFRVTLEKELAITPRLSLFGEAEYDSHDLWEGQAGLSYLITANLSLVGKWHSDYGWGGGLRFSF